MSDVSDPTDTAGEPARAKRAARAAARKSGAAAAKGAGAKGARAGAKAGAQRAGGGARKAAAAKPASAPAPVTGPAEGGTMKAKEFMARVLARSGANRTVAKPVIDAVLVELGLSLARGEAFVLPPLGRGRVRPAKDGAKAGFIQVKIKQGDAKKDGDTPLAPEED
jgi:hypothetical protein